MSQIARISCLPRVSRPSVTVRCALHSRRIPMTARSLFPLSLTIATIATAAVLAACANEAPVQPPQARAVPTPLAGVSGLQADPRIVLLRRVTDRYHEVDVA